MASPETGESPRDAAAGLENLVRERLTEAIQAADERSARRIGGVGTSVAFRIAGRQRAACALLCDQIPPVVRVREEPAESDIIITSDQVHRFVRGELCLPALVLAGEVAYEGSPRKFLAIEPILRMLLSTTHAPQREEGPNDL